MPLDVSSPLAHRQEAKIVLYSLWYQSLMIPEAPDDGHVCSKHVEA